MSSLQNGVNVHGPHGVNAMALYPIERSYLLVATAEEYLSLAARVPQNTDTHDKLVATALGCLETTLKNMKLQPLQEAEIRYRYAIVLHEQTNNLMELEEVLGQGLMLCERHRMYDLKYNMQHLLCQVLFQRNHQASINLLENIINDVEAYQHTAWVYAFRFLRVTLSLKYNNHTELLVALSHLNQISVRAQEYSDNAISVMSCVLKALLCLHLRADDGRKEQAQRTIAEALAFQLDPAVQSTILVAMIRVADLSCSLVAMDTTQSMLKIDHVRQSLAECMDSWRDDGTLRLPINARSLPNAKGVKGVIQRDSNGSQFLVLRWLPRSLATALTSLLDGVVAAPRNTEIKLKPEHDLIKGISDVGTYLTMPRNLDQSPYANREVTFWCNMLVIHMRLYLVFLLCARTSWQEAEDHLAKVTKQLPHNVSKDIKLLCSYLQGVICQGSGSLTMASDCFAAEHMKIPAPSQSSSVTQTHLDVSLLAAMNALLIIRSSTNPLHRHRADLLSSLEPYCSRTQNRAMSVAYNIALAISQDTDTITHTKDCLNKAVHAVKGNANTSVACVTFALLNQRLFAGVLGTQAEKSAQVTYDMAKRSGDKVWISVASGVMANMHDVHSRTQQAMEWRDAGLKIAEGLPKGLQRVEERNGRVQVVI